MNEKLNIQDLIDMLAARHDMDKKDADSFVKVFFQLIEESLEKDKYVKIRGLGTFKLIDVDSRESINVNTGERIEIQGYTKVSFTPETSLKNAINRPFSCFETVVLNEETMLEDTLLETESEEKGYLEQETIESEMLVAGHSSQEEPAKEEVEIEGTTENSMVAEAGFVNPEVNSVEINENDTEPEIKIIEKEEEQQKEGEMPTISEEDLVTLEKTPVEEEPVISEIPIKSGEKTASEEEIQEKEISSVQEKEPIVSENKAASEVVGEAGTPKDSIVIRDKKKETNTMRLFVGIVVSAVVLCGVAVAFVYSPDLMNKAMGKPFEGELVEVEDSNKSASIDAYNNTLTEEIIPEDSLDSAHDTILEVSVDALTVAKPETQVQTVESFVPNYDNSYEIVGTETTYTIKEGDMLTRIALHYYGTKLLWPYIVKHNPTVIKNPNNVPCGTIIKIPKLIKKQ